MMTNKMIIYFNMLGSLTKNRVESNMNNNKIFQMTYDISDRHSYL